ncbi:MAG: response regulator [Anaerolineae bacterium]|jgi:PleD family two-component response regulator|nr:response regulator [Anaerolineae bacterium]MBT4311691.1 response regulator [Anaerolineae bacterium]MBT4457746.1 response regulator [Anaerolineae bacterium]MBT6061185.1 response regulator [Anaerolineae bacterium]MBT6321151.1 response regulator [Anaerolineae bacterium]
MAKPFVLIIEDDRDVAALFRHVVDMAGYSTATALSEKDAIDLLSKSKPEIVILDLNLPGGSGREILKRIRKDKRLDQTKILVITAHTYVPVGSVAGPDLILSKPVSIEQLSLFIRRFGVPQESHTRPNPWDRKTGLYNQSFFMHRLASSLIQTKENDHYLYAILSFRLILMQEHNKKNSLDILIWETTLRELVETLKSTLRPTDTIASFDQDNFYILIENIANEDVPLMVATRLEKILNENLVSIGYKNQNPIRIGVTLCDSRYGSVKKVLHEAKSTQTLAIAQGDDYFKNFTWIPKKK